MALPLSSLSLTSQDPIERMDQFITQLNTVLLPLQGCVNKEDNSIVFHNGTMCNVTVRWWLSSGSTTPFVVLASRSYFVDSGVWGDVDPKKIVYSLILDEMGLSPVPEPEPQSLPDAASLTLPSLGDDEEAKKTRDMAVGILNSMSNPDYEPTQETMSALLRQVGKMSFGALRKMDLLRGTMEDNKTDS